MPFACPARARTSCRRSSHASASSTSPSRSSSRTTAEVEPREFPERPAEAAANDAPVDPVHAERDAALTDDAASEAPPGQPDAVEPEPADAEPEQRDADADDAGDAPADRAVPGVSAPVPTGPRTVGRLVADALRAAGVRYAFTVPGESFLGVLDALGDAGIRVVATRHEGGAAFMAEAHGNLTGRPAACLGTRAVGGANLAIGIHTARSDSSPMFAIVGQVERAHRGHEAFQEIDQVATIGGLATWAAEPDSPERVAPVLTEAIRQATTGRPGPVLLSFAEDLLDLEAPEDARVETARVAPSRPSDEEIRDAIELLASS